MNPKRLILLAALVWIGSIAAAFWIGRSTVSSERMSGGDGGGKGSGTRLSALRHVDAGGGAADDAAEFADSEFNSSNPGNRVSQLQLALAERNPIARMSALMAVIANMEVDEFGPALDALGGELRDGEKRREIGLLLYAWAEKDGAAALEYLDEASLGRDGYSLYYSALSAWGSNDGAAAEAWAKQKHEGKDNNENYYMLGVIDGLAKHDLPHAAQLTQDLGYGRARGEALGKVVDELFREGDQAARQWVESIGDEDERFRAGAAGRVAAEIAREDPRAAGEWVMGLGIAEKDRAIASVAYEWGRKSPAEAADWVSGIEDLDLRSRGIESVVETWTRQDADAAGTWLGQMPASPELDRPVRSYAMMVQERDPGAAIAWANTITDEKLRGETIERIGGEWIRRSPDEAKAFLLEQDGVPESLQPLIR